MPRKSFRPKARTVLIYGHYDVMPVDPRGEWRSDPFEPVVRDGRIWGRGADDDKGQLWMHAKAFEAMCATGTLPCNVKFMLEGEEEIGSPSLYGFCRAVQKVAQGRRDPRLGHLDALDADPVDHLRPARPGLHGGRGGRGRTRTSIRGCSAVRWPTRPTCWRVWWRN